MNIDIERMVVSLTGNEASQLAFHIKQSLEARIKDHWKNHPDAYRARDCGLRDDFNMMKQLAIGSGRDGEWMERELDSLLDKLSAKPAESEGE